MARETQSRGETPVWTPIDGNSGVRARVALNAGDFAYARKLAQELLKDPDVSAPAKKEALSILDATKIDKGPIIAGILMALVLAVLFIFVLTRPHLS